MALERLAIVGVGLIGGSLALAARRSGFARHIVGVDRLAAAEERSAAESRTVVDEWVDADDEARVREALSHADLTVLAMPVSAITRLLPLALAGGGVITDCGSTKRSIAEKARGEARSTRFVPGHPMAGHPEGGLVNAREDLFDGRRWLLCPEGVDPDAVARVDALVRAVGAEPVLLDATSHDRAVALTSHVPQLVASALLSLGVEEQADVAAGPAFASITRVAGGARVMWQDIFDSNADEVAAALRRLSAELDSVASGLEQGDVEPALELLARARRALGRE
jgi:prephenate dehydrogenase